MHGIRIPDDWRFMRIKEDIDAGRLWKARDRLQGHLRESPADQVVLDLLGSVWFAMGDMPQAGRHWWLTERKDENATAARDAFYERFGSDARGVLRALPRPARPEHYPNGVRVRLEELVTAANADGIGWRPSDWKPIQDESAGWDDDPSGRREAFLVVLAFGAIIVLIIIGAITVISWIVGLVS